MLREQEAPQAAEVRERPALRLIGEDRASVPELSGGPSPAAVALEGRGRDRAGDLSLSRSQWGVARRQATAEEADALVRLFADQYHVRLDYTVLNDWRTQYQVFCGLGIEADQIISHCATFLVGVHTGQQSVPTCGDCGHSPHHADEARGVFCTAVREMDDGPHVCGCDVDELSGKAG